MNYTVSNNTSSIIYNPTSTSINYYYNNIYLTENAIVELPKNKLPFKFYINGVLQTISIIEARPEVAYLGQNQLYLKAPGVVNKFNLTAEYKDVIYYYKLKNKFYKDYTVAKRPVYNLKLMSIINK